MEMKELEAEYGRLIIQYEILQSKINNIKKLIIVEMNNSNKKDNGDNND